jgi:hypothetical protein
MTLRLRNKRQTESALSRDWRDMVPNRPQPRRRLKGGRLVPVKSDPVSRRIRITTGVDSKAVRGELDQRFGFAKAISTYTEQYRAHVASDSVVMDDLCRSAAVHKAIRNLALARMNGQPFDNADQARAAYEALRRADADHRAVLAVLGIQRREKEIPDLQSYLAQKAKERDAE